MSTLKSVSSKRYNEYELPGRGKIIITRSLQGQINYLHKKVGSVEWSGFLFYRVLSGGIDKPEELVIEARNIYLLDIGSSAYTSREGANSIDEMEILDMYDKIPGASDEGSRYGFIHTHHNMQAFFSGTDVQELHDNVDAYGVLVSLIVNFDGKYCCKAAFKSSITSTFDSFGKKKKFTQEVLAIVNLDVVGEGYEVPPFLEERYKEVKERNEKKRLTSFSPYGRGFGKQTSMFGEGGFFGGKGAKNKDESLWEEEKEERLIGEGLGKNLKRRSMEGKSAYSSYQDLGKRKVLRNEITTSQAVEVIKDWLDRGIAQLVDVDSPHYNFPGIDLKILFLENMFQDKNTPEYKRFLSDLQDHLIDASAEYKPSVVGHRISEYLKTYSDMEIVKDLRDIAASHDNYCKAVLETWIV